MPGALEHSLRQRLAKHVSPLAGKPAPKEMLIDLARLEREYFERQPDVADPNQMVSFGTSGHRGISAPRHLQRSAHSRHHAGDLRLPREPRHRRPALHGQGYACAVRAGAATALEVLAANGVETIIQRERRRHADAGHLARHPGLQPRPQGSLRRRHRDHAFAQSARGRRLQVQPAQRRSGRHGRHELDRGPRERTAAREKCRREAHAVRHRPRGRRPRIRKTSFCPTSRSQQRRRHGRHPRRRPQARRRPAGRRGAAVLGADQLDLRTEHQGREPDHRSDLLVHDRRS